MRTSKLLSVIFFGSMLALTGCGDDDGSGNGGSGGTGGSNGSASSSCEAICSGNCLFGGVNPDVGSCLSQCEAEAPELDDNCGPEMEAFLDCLEANDCNPIAFDCLSEAQAWADCNEPEAS